MTKLSSLNGLNLIAYWQSLIALDSAMPKQHSIAPVISYRMATATYVPLNQATLTLLQYTLPNSAVNSICGFIAHAQKISKFIFF